MTKVTKRSLLTSALALVVCVSMLIGTTYAWFTDSVTSANNIITSGNLDVELEYATVVDGQTTIWKTVQGADKIFNPEARWEPGRVEVVYLKVSNLGSLALKYQLGVNVVSEIEGVNAKGDTFKLSDYLVFKVINVETSNDTFTTYTDREAVQLAAGTEMGLKDYNGNTTALKKGEKDYVALIVYMPETVGNVANHNGKDVPVINLGINLFATQQMAENDSFGDDYDEDAWNDGFKVYSADDLQDAIDNGKDVVLMNNIEGAINITEDVAINLNGNTFTGTILAPDANITLANGKIANDNRSASAIEINSGSLVIEDVEIESARHALRIDGDVDVVIKDGTFKTVPVSGQTQHALNVSGGATVEIYGGTFIGPKGTASDSGSAVVAKNSDVKIYGGNFSGGKSKTVSGTVTVYGGTFDQDPATYATVATGYTVVPEDGVYTVIKGVYDIIANVDQLKAAIANGGSYALSANLDVTEGFTLNTGKTLVLNLNGKTIAATETATGSAALITNKGNLTITGNGKMTLKATNNRGWNAYSSVISNSVGGKLVVENGTIEHLGGTDMAYAIDNLTNGKNTYAETIINGGTIKSTYRAVRMFLNGTEAKNILTVNGGVIEGANKSIWMQDPSENANTGSLEVSENAVLNGDVYVYVTAGSTEFPATVKIADKALSEGSKILEGNTASVNKVVANIDGVWTLVEGKAITTLDDLQKALDEAKDGDTIVLGASITGDVTVTQKPDVKITIDGNGNTFAGVLLVDGKSATYTTAGLTVKNVMFKADSISADARIQLGDGTNATRYTCNVTVDGCTFDVPGAVGVKSYTGGDKNLVIKNSTVTAKGHSLVQVAGVDKVLIDNCKVYSKNGANFNSSTDVTVIGSTFDVQGYAVRYGAGSAADTNAETYAIKDCTLKSACAESGDAVIVLRGTAANATLTIENTTITGTPDITNNAQNATVVK